MRIFAGRESPIDALSGNNAGVNASKSVSFSAVNDGRGDETVEEARDDADGVVGFEVVGAALLLGAGGSAPRESVAEKDVAAQARPPAGQIKANMEKYERTARAMAVPPPQESGAEKDATAQARLMAKIKSDIEKYIREDGARRLQLNGHGHGCHAERSRERRELERRRRLRRGR